MCAPVTVSGVKDAVMMGLSSTTNLRDPHILA